MSYTQRERPTILDGRVIDFAKDFKESGDGPFKRYEPLGGWHISASRNAVMVHAASFATEAAAVEFMVAMQEAIGAAKRLSKEDRGNFQ